MLCFHRLHSLVSIGFTPFSFPHLGHYCLGLTPITPHLGYGRQTLKFFHATPCFVLAADVRLALQRHVVVLCWIGGNGSLP